MHVIGFRKHLACDFPGSRAASRHKADDLTLTLADAPQIAVEEFLIIMHRSAVATVHQRRRKRA